MRKAAIYGCPLLFFLDDGGREIRQVAPWEPTTGLLASSATEYLAVLPERERRKPESGLWLTAEGWAAYLAGETVESQRHLVESGNLLQIDTRTGIGLDADKRSAAEGKLFTVQAVSLGKIEHSKDKEKQESDIEPYDVGFLPQVEGVSLPERINLRLGGDGRGAIAISTPIEMPQPDYDAIARAGRCRIILTMPGLFADGWIPTGVSGTGKDLRFDLGGVKARLVCAAVPRAEVISGWDLAAQKGKGAPKPAQRVAPTGSVYWLEDLKTSAEDLR